MKAKYNKGQKGTVTGGQLLNAKSNTKIALTARVLPGGQHAFVVSKLITIAANTSVSSILYNFHFHIRFTSPRLVFAWELVS